jgi:hypothetical protein
MGLVFLLVLALGSQLSVRVGAAAPEDAEIFCLNPPALQPSFVPPNATILMDSHNYFTLLSGPGAVWQQVDLDEIPLTSVSVLRAGQSVIHL